jgi:hypothetical protein
LESQINKQHSEIVKLKENIHDKGLTATNVKMLLGENGFHERIDAMIRTVRESYDKKLKAMEKKLFSIQSQTYPKVIANLKKLSIKIYESNQNSKLLAQQNQQQKQQ